MGRRPLLALVGALLLAAAALPGLAAGASGTPKPRASLTDIENDVMCTSCREPLAVAQSPQANSERAFISRLIAKGYTKAQIERILVVQYGTAVLAKPPAQGFNLVVYILPPAILIVGIVVLAVTLPKWRRRTRARGETEAAPPAIDPGDAQRLEHELARYEG